MLRAILNKSRRQHPQKQQLYCHQPPVMKTIKIRGTRHAGLCWRSGDELVSDVLLWTPSCGRAKAARTYIQQLCADTGYNPEDLLKAMDDREGWRERVRNIGADCVTSWWWWWGGGGYDDNKKQIRCCSAEDMRNTYSEERILQLCQYSHGSNNRMHTHQKKSKKYSFPWETLAVMKNVTTWKRNPYVLCSG